MRRLTAIILIVLFFASAVAACAYEFRYKKTVEVTRTKKLPDSTKVKKP
jgi:hypothetical protein